MTPQASFYEIDERAAEAGALLDNPVFKLALAHMKAEYEEQLLNADLGTSQATQAHASLRAVREIETQIRSFITDRKFAMKQGNRQYG